MVEREILDDATKTKNRQTILNPLRQLKEDLEARNAFNEVKAAFKLQSCD